MIWALMLMQAAPAPVEEWQVWQKAWDTCVTKFADNASITHERADVIAQTALYSCETEERNVAFFFAKHILAKSVTIHTEVAAKASADRFVASQRVELRKSAMIEISYQRQMAILDRQAKEARRATDQF